MKFWDQLLHTALLGTEKKQLSVADLPDQFKPVQQFLEKDQALDKEEKFLQLAALAYNFRQCGRVPFPREAETITVSDAEIKSYCSSKSLQILKDILGEDNPIPLLRFWLKQCSAADRVVQPDMIPELFQMAASHKFLRKLISEVNGKRGEWLSRFNPAWQFPTTTDQYEIWQNGTGEERKNMIKELRSADPKKARELLAESWDKENGNTKTEFLKLFDGNTNTDDREWLESLLAEKSTKLRDEVLNLLKQLPGSSVTEGYWQIVQKAVTLKKGKALLGMMNKTSLIIEPPAHVDEAQYKMGIEKLSNNKQFSDEEYVIFQMMHFIPPDYWETHFGERPESIFLYFEKDKSGLKYLPALTSAIVRFKNRQWAEVFAQHAGLFHPSIFFLIPDQEKERYAMQHFDKLPDEVIQSFSTGENNWSPKLTRLIFSHSARNPYKFTRLFFSEHIERLPNDIHSALSGTNPPEEHLQVQWSKTNIHILKLHSIKQETIKSFNE